MQQNHEMVADNAHSIWLAPTEVATSALDTLVGVENSVVQTKISSKPKNL
jgi:hypothetical protein